MSSEAKSSGLRSRLQPHPSALWGPSLLFVACYLSLSVRDAIRKPLWMDEVLAVWASRFPTPSKINWALMHGAQSAPPAFSVLVHYYAMIAGQSNLALRLPSIAAGLLTAGVLFLLLGRFLAQEPAIFASCFTLEILSPYAQQVRPYTLLTACFALVLLLWDDLNTHRSTGRVMSIGLLLAFATALHFYAVLFVPCFGLIELNRTFRTREFRPSLWLAFVIAGASIFLWSPVMNATRGYIRDDVSGSFAYGPKPTLELLLSSYSYLFQGVGNLRHLGNLGLPGVIVLSTVVLIGIHQAVFRRPVSRSGHSIDSRRRADFWEIVTGTLLLPAILFVFTFFVSKSYNVRYVIAASLGASALLAEVLDGFPAFRRVVPIALLVGTVSMLTWGVPSIDFSDHASVYREIPGSEPIVVADGSQFFQLEYSSPPEFKARLAYLTLPPGVPIGDATNEHVIERCRTPYPALPVSDMQTFLRSTPRYFVLDDRTADDTPATYLEARKLIRRWKVIGGAVIYRSLPDSLWAGQSAEDGVKLESGASPFP